MVVGQILRFITQILGATRLLTLAKPISGVQLITMGEMFYQLVCKALCLPFRDAFSLHLSPHQFGVVVRDGCVVMIHII